MSASIDKRIVWRAGKAGPVTSDRKSLVLVKSTGWKPGGALQCRGAGPGPAWMET